VGDFRDLLLLLASSSGLGLRLRLRLRWRRRPIRRSVVVRCVHCEDCFCWGCAVDSMVYIQINFANDNALFQFRYRLVHYVCIVCHEDGYNTHVNVVVSLITPPHGPEPHRVSHREYRK